MAESAVTQQQEIEAQTQDSKQQRGGGRFRLRLWKKKSAGGASSDGQQKERPRDAVKLGCGGLFRRKKKQNNDQPTTDKPRKNKSIKGGTVKIEQGPHTEMWSSIVNKSFIGTSLFAKAAVCSLTSGGVLACNPADFTPSVEQVAALRDNFNNRDAFSAAGFGIGDTVFQLQEETATDDILCGADAEQTQAVLVTLTNTALVACVCTGNVDRATGMLGDMREHFITQGM